MIERGPGRGLAIGSRHAAEHEPLRFSPNVRRWRSTVVESGTEKQQ
jgi:hypothetical protein